MAYIALYREWRPKNFAEIVGQKHVSQTLQNAIKNNRIAHAYLFCGPRGTGKTSSAKVLAKALNCIKGPTHEPCNECENCRRISLGTSMDVLEIDAASNRGIDEIRDLREKIKFAPTEGLYKIYIIDEVHMLTNEAFNALLKTLEEPPKHVIFVLATTEPHKIPLTILSRCQRFDFKRIELKDIAQRIKYICDQTGLTIEPEALTVISKAAEGGMRDALSILDQVIAFGGNEIRSQQVNDVLGTVGSDVLFNFSEALNKKDLSAVLELMEHIIIEGKDLKQMLGSLIDHFRNLLLVSINTKKEDCGDYANDYNRLLKHSQTFEQNQIIEIINIFMEAEQNIKWTSQPRLTVELAFIKACSEKMEVDVQSLVQRISELEQKIATGLVANSQTSAEKPKRKATSVRTRSLVRLGINSQEDLNKILGSWPEVLENVKKIRVTAKAFLTEATPIHVEGNIVTLQFRNGCTFHRENIEQAENKKAVEFILTRILGKQVEIRCVLASEIENDNQEKQEQSNNITDPALQLFGHDVVEIKD